MTPQEHALMALSLLPAEIKDRVANAMSAGVSTKDIRDMLEIVQHTCAVQLRRLGS